MLGECWQLWPLFERRVLDEGGGGQFCARTAVAWVTDVHGSSVGSEGFLFDGIPVLAPNSTVIEV